MSTKSKRDRAKKGGESGKRPARNHAGVAANLIGMLGMNAVIKAGLAEPLSDLRRIECGIKYWMALHLIKTSPAVTEFTWMPLCEALNIGMILAERGLGKEHEQLFIAAQDAIVRAWKRAGDHASARLDGMGMATISCALEVHDVQLEIALRGQLAVAEREMLRRSKEGNFVRAEDLAKAA